jgi:hypothetical protein
VGDGKPPGARRDVAELAALEAGDSWHVPAPKATQSVVMQMYRQATRMRRAGQSVRRHARCRHGRGAVRIRLTHALERQSRYVMIAER